MTMLYSINLRIQGNTPNLQLIKVETLKTWLAKLVTGTSLPFTAALLIFLVLVVIGIKILLDLFLRTNLGLLIRAMGNNQQMVLGQGNNIKLLKMIGVGLSNGLVALSGAIASQNLGFADVNLGQGIIISGLASVMIGEMIIPSRKIVVMTFRALIGSIVYKAVMYAGREWGYVIGLNPNDLKLIIGILIVGILIFTNLKKWKESNRKLAVSGRRS
jgi:putative ABC transport system permease protein